MMEEEVVLWAYMALLVFIGIGSFWTAITLDDRK